MGEYLTEDEVRENAGKILGFTKLKHGKCGVGQITTFNQLGIKEEGKDKKPDGWYLLKTRVLLPLFLKQKTVTRILVRKNGSMK